MSRQRHQLGSLPVAVIGAGAGGLPAAVALAEAGLQVVMLEQGREILPDEFSTNRYDYELGPAPWEQSGEAWQGPVPLQQGVGLGGSTLYFQGVAQLPSNRVFQQWGLDPKQLSRCYQEVIDFLQIAGEVQPAHPLNPVSNHLLQSAKKMGWDARPAPVAILSRPHDGRPQCNYCGQCVFGCRLGDKGSTNNTWLPRARKSGRVRIATNTRVDAIELSSTREAKVLRVTDQDGSYTLPVRAVVLAAGVMETPYLLIKSRQPLAPEGIGNQNVGRNLIGSLWQSQLVVLPQTRGGGHAGIPIDLIIEEFMDRGILLSQGRSLAGILGPVSAARFAAKRIRQKQLRPWMRENYAKLAGLSAYAESSVAFEDGLDRSGSRRFHKPLRSTDYERITKMKSLLQRWGEAANAEVLASMGSTKRSFIGAMFRGTCRMGNDPEHSAVTPDGRLRGYDNIVVADASILGSGLVAHPSLPLQVLGLYIGRELANRLQAAVV